MENRRPYKPMVVWIVFVILMVYAMVVVGGLTRLTNSGLSIVNWQPIVGALPPLSDQDWADAFDKYKLYPEYQKVNLGMSLDQFKGIFYWEYSHRLLGRMIGIVFLFPYLFFLYKGRIKGSTGKKLFFAFLLGGAQGLLGWLMVKSGLVDLPRVSHYRLAAHLGLAFFLLSYLYWIFLSLTVRRRLRVGEPSFRILSIFTLALIVTQLFFGALTAGLDAGLMYNTFPDMNGTWAPLGMFSGHPTWLNLFENPVTVQFIHRMFGWMVLMCSIVTLFLGFRHRARGTQRTIHYLLFIAIMFQFILGVSTLLLKVPVHLASMHQAGAGIVLLLAVSNMYIEFRGIKDRIGA